MLASSEELASRRAEVEQAPALRALCDRLWRLVQPLMDRSIFIPPEKARLSVDGGRCPVDGCRLSFDPLSPHKHRCPRCGASYNEEHHYRHWIWPYQLWLSERAIHLALLGQLRGDRTAMERARMVLEGYALQYRDYPNRDNVLGPTRLFFSTYLESIWLIQVTIAASIVGRGGPRGFDEMVAESAALICSFDEGFSNRQVWHDTALIAAGQWLADSALIERGLEGKHGLEALLSAGVGADGMWFEGENYHLFALRGFLLAAELLRGFGVDLYDASRLRNRLLAMYEAPLATVLPDLTLAARGDAPFGVSIRQPRFAELWEIGWLRTRSDRLASVLADLYEAEIPALDDPGFVEIAEQEQNRPATTLDRSLLGWKALLWMDPDPPVARSTDWHAGNCLLPQAGVAVLRPSSTRYASVECGDRVAGHGHPDALHLTLFWDRPLFNDPGTGSYVSRQLHWYRSTLAHNAPGVAGIGQRSHAAWCRAFDHVADRGWVQAVGEGILGPGTRVTRSVITGARYVVDMLEVQADDDVVVDLPIHAHGGLDHAGVEERFISIESTATHGHEHGYDALTDVRELVLPASDHFKLGDADGFRIHFVRRTGEQLLKALGPGPSDAQFAEGALEPFVIRRCAGGGTWVQCYAFDEAIAGVRATAPGTVLVEWRDGRFESMAVEDDGCRITDREGQDVVLRGTREPPASGPQPGSSTPPVRVPCRRLSELPPVREWDRYLPTDTVATLTTAHYRKSERDFGSMGDFWARVAIFSVGDRICYAADVIKQQLHFRRPSDPDPRLDNEAPDIHSDGMQCYLGLGCWEGYVVVPDADGESVHVRGVAGTGADPSRVAGSWAPTPVGYRMLVSIATGQTLTPGSTFSAKLVINEMYPDRERRAGQLVWGGRGGGFVYLRGDREHPATAIQVVMS